MFITALLLSLISTWYYLGFWPALALLAVGSLVPIRRRRGLFFASVGLGILVLGQLERTSAHVLPRSWVHQRVPLTVCLEQPPKPYLDYSSAMARVVEQPEALSLRRVRLTLPIALEPSTLLAGHCLRGDFQVRQPFGYIIPGAFNADSFNFATRIDAKASLKTLHQQDYRPTLAQSLYHQRQGLFDDAASLELWRALALGWSAALSSELRTDLAQNQLVHLLVVSGMHIGFVSLMVLALVNGVAWLCAGRLMIPQTHRYLVVLTIVAAYVALLGWPVPATRALLMALLPVVLVQVGWQVPWYSGLTVAAIGLTLMRPEAWLGLGAWLSFSSVLIILLLWRWRLIATRHWLLKLVLFQVFMSLSILPWALVFGFYLNPLAALVNLLVTPCLALLLLPLALAILLLGRSELVPPFEWGVEMLIRVMAWAGDFGTLLPWWPLLTVVLATSLLMLFAWLPDRRFKLVLGLLFGLGFMTFHLASEPRATRRVTVFDVGHGQAVLIEHNDDRWLYDTGGQSGVTSLFERNLARRVRSLSGLVVSHSDIDHAAGADFILTRDPQLVTWAGQPRTLTTVPAARSAWRNCHRAGQLNDFLRFIPIPSVLMDTDNNHSCILVYDSGFGRVLITGDASKRIEYFILQQHPELFPFDMIVLGHHGSASSSAQDWLTANRSALFILSSADRARPRWPSPMLLSWFNQPQRRLLSTAKVGTIQVTFGAQGMRYRSWDSAFRKRLIY
ncbi:DNA internalization-related protein competence protein ComEC/Rec2 [Reinekea forsetii]|uniref:DNA internalization-related protein competence protein ComEC/Rec2 n=1 Tax=Reinekea forsetii TaxID=1336806 RepID=A0A2K8KPW1_9GAMM|nr:DNA internalization-related protein competence protein ComEC/Rec2 [Reinekea forsetii]